MTRLGIKPKSTAPEADALTIRPSKLLFILWRMQEEFRGREEKLNMCFVDLEFKAFDRVPRKMIKMGIKKERIGSSVGVSSDEFV